MRWESRPSPRRNAAGQPAARSGDGGTTRAGPVPDRLRQDFGDRGRQLQRLLDLGFPEVTRLVRDLGSELATAPSAGALASYVRAVPALKQSGKRTFQRASLTPIGAAGLRAKLWIPVLTAVRRIRGCVPTTNSSSLEASCPRLPLVAADLLFDHPATCRVSVCHAALCTARHGVGSHAASPTTECAMPIGRSSRARRERG
jgi:Transposase IS116/IS110/IS902 family